VHRATLRGAGHAALDRVLQALVLRRPGARRLVRGPAASAKLDPEGLGLALTELKAQAAMAPALKVDQPLVAVGSVAVCGVACERWPAAARVACGSPSRAGRRAQADRPHLVEADHHPVSGRLGVEREHARGLGLLVGVGAGFPRARALKDKPAA
jgi:hypothetical protein